LIILKI